jgi:hypothetical protein
MDPSVCEICRNIPDFAAANLREGESLPDAVADLVDAYPTPEGFWDTSKEYETTKEVLAVRPTLHVSLLL